MERIVCPTCGKQIEATGILRAMAGCDTEEELWGVCVCRQRYCIRLSFLNGLIFSFPDRNMVLLC